MAFPRKRSVIPSPESLQAGSVVEGGIIKMIRKKGIFFLAALCLLFQTWAANAAAAVRENSTAESERSERAVQVLNELNKAPDKGIPKDLLDDAQGIAIIPHVVKAALGFGGSWGKGLISVRKENGGWSQPVFIDITGGSFGFQIGAQATDVVLVFTDRKGIDSLLGSKLKLGADASVAAGPVGRTGSAGTDIKLKSAVYSYSRSKGLFAGIALDGAVITVDKDADHRVYGEDMSATDILAGKGEGSEVTSTFVAALNRYSPSTVKSARMQAPDSARQVPPPPPEMARASIPRSLDTEYDRAQRAGLALHEIVATKETGIPEALMDRAYGVAVIPNVVKAAFILGGSWGKGLLSVRQNGNWSPAAYIEITGGSFGFQIGGEATDLVLVFTDEGSVRSLLSSKLKLGADASVAAGPIGRSGEAGTDLKLNAAIYSYSRSRGVFAGVALDGAVISMDDGANRAVYGKDVTGREILLEQRVGSTPVTQPFLASLREYSPKATR